MSERTGATESQVEAAFRRHELWDIAGRDDREIIEIDGYGWANRLVPPGFAIVAVKPTPEQIEYAAIALQCETEVQGMTPVRAWSQTDMVLQDAYRALAKSAWDAFLEGPEFAKVVADVRAEINR